MSENYVRILLKNVPASAEDVITEMCFAAGAQGLSEELAFRQTSEAYEPETLARPYIDLNVYFADPPEGDFLEDLRTRHPSIVVEAFNEAHRDWLSEWKKGFKPFPLTGGVWVVPSWEPVPAEARQALRIDPGMAFGTGTHATTQLAAQLLDRNGCAGSLLDVGTGTGILAMLARLKGCGRIVATEIDPDARRTARENLALNGMTDIEVPEHQIDTLTESFDWVVANIIDGVLLELEPDLVRLVKPGGTLLLTGILLEREDRFLRRWASPLTVRERAQLGDWVGYVMEKTP